LEGSPEDGFRVRIKVPESRRGCTVKALGNLDMATCSFEEKINAR
jgi:hypothetical protein